MLRQIFYKDHEITIEHLLFNQVAVGLYDSKQITIDKVKMENINQKIADQIKVYMQYIDTLCLPTA